MTLILNDRGVPEAPTEIRRRVQQVHGALDVRWMDGRWAITYDWPSDDPRRQMIRNGEMAEGDAFDCFAWLPKDCSVEEAYGYITRSFRSWSGSREDVAAMCSRLHHYNDAVQEARKAGVMDFAEELIDTNKATLGRSVGIEGIKPVFQNEGTTQGKSNRKRVKHAKTGGA